MARPSSYRDEFAKQAYKLALVGMTDHQLADFFEVDERTINRWKLKHAPFRQSLKRGKDEADAMVAQSLYRRALGYSHKAVKIVTVAQGNNQGSDVVEVPYTERYPPDTTACIFWLKNRQRANWRDKTEDGDGAADPNETARQVREAIRAMRDADGLKVA
jgi:hypothetical protein